MSKQVILQEMEQALEQKFKGKNCSFEYPGYKTVYGMVDSICINVLDNKECVIIMNDKRYTCELLSLKEHLKLLKKFDGNT